MYHDCPRLYYRSFWLSKFKPSRVWLSRFRFSEFGLCRYWLFVYCDSQRLTVSRFPRPQSLFLNEWSERNPSAVRPSADWRCAAIGLLKCMQDGCRETGSYNIVFPTFCEYYCSNRRYSDGITVDTHVKYYKCNLIVYNCCSQILCVESVLFLISVGSKVFYGCTRYI